MRALRESDIPVIVLKGACLAETIYGNIALRSMGDVDLLVRREDMARVVQILGNLGYSAGYDYRIEDELAVNHHLPPMKGPRQLTIEVHWTIVDAPHFAALEEKEIAKTWETRKGCGYCAGASVFMLAPEDLVLHLCVHFTMQHLCDIRLRAYWI